MMPKRNMIWHHDDDLDNDHELPQLPPRRSNRLRHSSSRYSSDEYVTLTDGGELECFEEALESEEKQQ